MRQSGEAVCEYLDELSERSGGEILHLSTPALKQQTSQDEADIRAIIESVQRAHHTKDAAAIAAPFAPQAAIFNLAPPLAHCGVDIDEKKTWLDTWEGPIDLETRDLHITVSGDSAFGYGFYRMSGTPKAAAGLSASGCGRRFASSEVKAPGALCMSTRPCRFTWTAACGRLSTSNRRGRSKDGLQRASVLGAIC